MEDYSSSTGRILACAIEVHRQLGPGLRETIYEAALAREMDLRGLRFRRQATYTVFYKGHPVGTHRLDLVVANSVVVEIKSVEAVVPIFEAQILAYLRVTGIPVGLLINFNCKLLKDGIRRFVL
jgi:GxxExxY protein